MKNAQKEKTEIKYTVDSRLEEKAELERQIRVIWKAMKHMGERERQVLVGLAKGLAAEP